MAGRKKDQIWFHFTEKVFFLEIIMIVICKSGSVDVIIQKEIKKERKETSSLWDKDSINESESV